MIPGATFSPGLDHGVDPKSLHESPENPRTIDADRFEALVYALENDPSMLPARPIIADVETGEVVCGNMRLRAARELNWATVPVYFHRFESEAQKREWMLRDNQEYGEWVPDQLAQMIYEHQSGGFDTGLLGFRDDEIEAAIRRATGEAIVPDASDPPTPTLAAEVMIEIRCTRDALDMIQSTLEDWQDQISGIEIAVSQ